MGRQPRDRGRGSVCGAGEGVEPAAASRAGRLRVGSCGRGCAGRATFPQVAQLAGPRGLTQPAEVPRERSFPRNACARLRSSIPSPGASKRFPFAGTPFGLDRRMCRTTGRGRPPTTPARSPELPMLRPKTGRRGETGGRRPRTDAASGELSPAVRAGPLFVKGPAVRRRATFPPEPRPLGVTAMYPPDPPAAAPFRPPRRFRSPIRSRAPFRARPRGGPAGVRPASAANAQLCGATSFGCCPQAAAPAPACYTANRLETDHRLPHGLRHRRASRRTSYVPAAGDGERLRDRNPQSAMRVVMEPQTREEHLHRLAARSSRRQQPAADVRRDAAGDGDDGPRADLHRDPPARHGDPHAAPSEPRREPAGDGDGDPRDPPHHIPERDGAAGFGAVLHGDAADHDVPHGHAVTSRRFRLARYQVAVGPPLLVLPAPPDPCDPCCLPRLAFRPCSLRPDVLQASQYAPQVCERQVPCTTMVPQVVRRQVPYTICRRVPETVVQRVPGHHLPDRTCGEVYGAGPLHRAPGWCVEEQRVCPHPRSTTTRMVA